MKIVVRALIVLSLLGFVSPAAARGPAKNVILLMGDGMGPPAISLLHYDLAREGRVPTFERIAEKGRLGMSWTRSADSVVTDSTAAASAMSTGHLTNNGSVGVDADGKRVEHVIEIAHRKGLRTGVVTNERITHATPAGFLVHYNDRGDRRPPLVRENYTMIGEHLLESGADVMMGGGAIHLIPAGVKIHDHPRLGPGWDGTAWGSAGLVSKRKDKRDILEEAASAGYKVVTRKKDIENVARGERLFGVFTAYDLPYTIDWPAKSEIPRLRDLASAALRALEGPEGFFLLVEAGRIDIAEHSNDSAALLHEMRDFEEVLALLADYQAAHPDTLLLVTADHDTGAFGMSYRMDADDKGRPWAMLESDKYRYIFGSDKHLAQLARQKRSVEAITRRTGKTPTVEALDAVVREETGIALPRFELERVRASNAQSAYFVKRGYQGELSTPLALALAADTLTTWGTGYHTAAPVFLVGIGPGEEGIRPFNPITAINRLIRNALGI